MFCTDIYGETNAMFAENEQGKMTYYSEMMVFATLVRMSDHVFNYILDLLL